MIEWQYSFRPRRSYARTSAYLAFDPENNNLPKHIYFQSTPDHVLSIDYSPWLDAALLCDSNGNRSLAFDIDHSRCVTFRSCLLLSIDELRAMDTKE